MDIKSHHFTLHATAEVEAVVSDITQCVDAYTTIHIAAYMHNTVMIHNLASSLEKKIENLTLVHLPLSRDEETLISVFTYSQEVHDTIIEKELPINELIANILHQENISMSKQVSHSKKELIKRYFTDTLTALPNLYQLREDLHDAQETTLILINIDNFKLINDFYGYVVGDFILEALAKKLNEETDDGVCYRVSGSQFAITQEKVFDFYQLKDFLKELFEKFKHTSFNYNNSKIYVDLTYASIPTAQRNELFSKVGMALQYAKDQHKEFWIYEDRMQFKKLYEQNLKTSLNIRDAITSSGIIPYFQPIINNKTDKIEKYESLSRLIDGQGNILAPEDFIPIAKTIKIYTEITKTIMTKTFDAFRDIDCDFSINLSLEDILNEEISSFIMKKLQESEQSHHVIFEILESEQIEDFEKISRFITEIKRHGAKIAIDDFGAGYSNFYYLAKLQIDFIKIDGSLIKNIDKEDDALIIVQTIVDFAKRLGIQTIAEHVHSSTVLDKVKLLGIDFSQGFIIDKPHPSISKEN